MNSIADRPLTSCGAAIELKQMLATHPYMRKEIKSRRKSIFSFIKHDDLYAKALQEWISAIMHPRLDHHLGLPCATIEDTLMSIRAGVSLVDKILHRIRDQKIRGWRMVRHDRVHRE